jgi:outer membrane protein assembly factor BamD (BamD/ComL family)
VDPKANDHLNDEADLLKRVQRAINGGDTGTALALLQQHATSYPSGVLVQERIGLRAITLCRAGQHDQGVAEATRFLKGNPSSPLSERVKSACELK